MYRNGRNRYEGLVAPRKWTWLDYYLKNYSPTMKILGTLFPGSGFDMSKIKTPEERAAERARKKGEPIVAEQRLETK